ncbi:MAG TPA: ferrochelatase [Burkholderiales bacterium]
MDQRPAVVLLNLGGPDSLLAVRPFLYNLFSDPDIFRLPLAWLTQRPFAWLVSRRRAPEAAKGYAAIGGKSPLLANTEAQARALQEALAVGAADARVAAAGGNHPAAKAGAPLADVYVCMRYWHPMAPEVVAELKRRGYRRVVLLPLYPQYSVTTTGSACNAFLRACRRQQYQPAIDIIREWYDEPMYQQAIVAALRRELAALPDPRPERVELLLSAHGLPRRLADAGDPYRGQIEATAAAVRARLGWPNVTLCYQSRVGPLEWLRPYTEDVIRAKGRAGAKQMLVYPIAFVSDHVETLYELGIVYAALAQESGIAHYRVVPALNDDPQLIEALRARVRRVLGV